MPENPEIFIISECSVYVACIYGSRFVSRPCVEIRDNFPGHPLCTFWETGSLNGLLELSEQAAWPASLGTRLTPPPSTGVPGLQHHRGFGSANLIQALLGTLSSELPSRTLLKTWHRRKGRKKGKRSRRSVRKERRGSRDEKGKRWGCRKSHPQDIPLPGKEASLVHYYTWFYHREWKTTWP